MHHFIFSSNRRTRICRHLVFWLGWYFYMVCTQVRNQTPQEIGMRSFVIYQLAVSANRLLLQALFCYTMIYYLVPRYFVKGKYALFSGIFLIAVVSLYYITYLDYIYIWSDVRSPLYFKVDQVKPLSPFMSRYFAVYSNIHFTGSLVACSMILTARYFKRWYQKQRENEMLLQENALAELQLLKAQVHPHFLFNTLNNIYALTMDNLPRASATVRKLSGMVSYMIREGAEPWVAVSKEINMLLDYIGLEKIRYGDRLTMDIDIDQQAAEEVMIAPLLLIPFVENCFKHGASRMIERPFISLSVKTSAAGIDFNICNSTPERPQEVEGRNRIGLVNVRKRLELIYPGRHQLVIETAKQWYGVHLRIDLKKQ